MIARKMLLALIPGLLAAPLAEAGGRHHATRDDDGDTVAARVVDVEPIYRHVQVSRPARECWDEEVTRPSRGHGGSAASMITGAVIGGAIGHNVYPGDSGKLAGAIIGSAIGHDIAATRQRDGGYRTVVERHCETVRETYSDKRIDHYRVTYRLHGRDYTTRLPYDPGEFIRVRVDVKPLRDCRRCD